MGTSIKDISICFIRIIKLSIAYFNSSHLRKLKVDISDFSYKHLKMTSDYDEEDGEEVVAMEEDLTVREEERCEEEEEEVSVEGDAGGRTDLPNDQRHTNLPVTKKISIVQLFLL